MAKGPLAGLKVLDFTHGVAGPYCTMVLADLGCEVIKIEKPGRGDPTRYMNVSPRFRADIPQVGGDYFLAINRNKKSLGLDMKAPEGVALCRELAGWADIAVQNFRPGVMSRLGLGYDELSKVNPRLLYGNISAYGRGPLEDKPGMDVAVQARSGVMRITGSPERDEPLRPGASLADFGGGIYLATALMAALYERERSGHGQEISVSLLDATMSMLINYSVAVIDGGVTLGPMGSGHPQLVPYQAFPTLDGDVVVSAGTNKIYRDFCAAIGKPELGTDERFATNQDRVHHRALLVPEIAAVTRTRSTEEWIGLLEAADVPCAPVNDLATAYRELGETAEDMVVEVQHEQAGSLHQLGVPFKFSRTPGEVSDAPPMLGQHTELVLDTVLKRSAAEIADLKARRVVG